VTKRASKGERTTWQAVIVCIWVAFVSASALKAMIPYVHWFATIAVVALLCPRFLGARYSRAVKFTMLGGSLLVLSIVIIVPMNLNPVYQLAEASKLAGILLVVTPLLLARSDTSRGLRLGAELAVAANGALVLMGFLGVSGVFTLMAFGRYGTVLNPPGSLWRVGILVLVSSSLNLLVGRSFLWPLIMFTCSVALLVFDGARTAGLSILVAFGFVAYFMVKEMRNRGGFATRRVLARMTLLGVVLIGGIVWRPIQEAYVGNVGFGDRLSGMFNAAESSGVEGVESTDQNRAEMLRVAYDAIAAHPLLGTGMGTTSLSGIYDGLVIHDAYLQVWADVGLFGFMAYVVLTIGILLGRWARRSEVARADISDRVSFHNGVYILTCWALSGLLHPLSTEISEWVMFIVGLAGMQVAFWLPRSRNTVFQFSGRDADRGELLSANLRS